MAERIDNITPIRGSAPKYPWGVWTDGSAWRISRGVDFSSTAHAMRAVITAYASRTGRRVRTSVPDERTVEFQFTVLKEAA